MQTTHSIKNRSNFNDTIGIEIKLANCSVIKMKINLNVILYTPCKNIILFTFTNLWKDNLLAKFYFNFLLIISIYTFILVDAKYD